MNVRKPRGITLIELIFALSISLFIFELLFYVYMVLFNSWDIGFMQGKSEDEASRALMRVSKETRAAHRNSIAVAPNWLRLTSDQPKVFYLYTPEMDYARFTAVDYPPTANLVLKLLTATALDQTNFGQGMTIVKSLVPPQGTSGTQFHSHGSGVELQFVSKFRDTGLTLNTIVYPRSKP